MFDITSSKLLILAIVALIVVGPKDLPILLRTVGKYLGVIRRQAAEFRQQFDEAMREAELDHLKKEFENVKREVRATMDEGARAVESQFEAAAVKEDPPKFGTAMPSTPQWSDNPAETDAPLPAPALAAPDKPDKEPDRGAA
jgi:sec-independent protein translocase protein TatB